MQRGNILLAATLLICGCHATPSEWLRFSAVDDGEPRSRESDPPDSSQEELVQTEPARIEEAGQGKAEREADPMIATGYVLRAHTGRGWGLHLMVPVILGLTAFDLQDALSLDQLATIAAVPTAEFIVPLNDRWTLQPFVGLGVAYQTGAAELIGDSDFFGHATVGLRTTRWQHFADRHWFGFTAQGRYDTALTSSADRLGDWGIFDLALELRRDFGAPREGPRFQGGVYVQGYKLWNPVELDISGISPTVVDDQVELGISLGSSSPYKLLGIALPHVFIGVFDGDGLRGVRIRFGRL